MLDSLSLPARYGSKGRRKRSAAYSQDRECGFESAERVVGIVRAPIDSVIELKLGDGRKLGKLGDGETRGRDGKFTLMLW
jgi:hypothetical protein